MTAEDVINAWLRDRYVGKRIAGPSWDPEPFTVADACFDQDYDYVSVWFWGPEWVPASKQRKAVNISFGRELPEVLP